MLNDASGFSEVYIACRYTDMRLGIDGLAAIVKNTFHLNPFHEGVLFLFCGRRTDRIKGLLFEGDGFLLLYKRLENARFQWPRNEAEMKQLTPQQFKWLMEGLAIELKKAIRKISPVSICYSYS